MSPLRVACGARDITPSEPGPLTGFAARVEDARGTLAPLSARALLLSSEDDEVALVAYDLIGVPEELPAAYRALCPAGPRLIPCATHTHAGPPVLNRALLGRPSAAYLDRLARETASLVEELRGRLVLGGLRHASTRVNGIAHNRRDREGPVDPTVDVVEAWSEAGDRLALWLNFACHPVVLGPNNLSYSPDFPGVTRERLEAALGVPVLYTTGCAGQVNTGHSAQDSITLSGLDRRTPQEAARIGGMLAEAVLTALRKDLPAVVTGGLRYREHALQATLVPPEASTRQALLDAAAATLADPASPLGARAMAAIDLAWADTADPGPITLTVGLLEAGPVRVAFLPGEVFVETALAIRAAMPGAFAVAYSFTNPGYIPHASAIPYGGYEVDTAYRPYGLAGPFSRDTAARLEGAALALLERTL